MKTLLVIALGNPDPEYLQTRHNVGWQFSDWLAKKYDATDEKEDKKLVALVRSTKLDKTKVVLIKPLTFVNKSGLTAAKARLAHKAKPQNIVLVHDDMDIPFGHCKLTFDKSSGGHRGVDSVIKALKTQKFWRIRIGTGVRALDKARQQTEKRRDEWVREFVLHPFTPSEKEELKGIFKECEIRLLQVARQK